MTAMRGAQHSVQFLDKQKADAAHRKIRDGMQGGGQIVDIELETGIVTVNTMCLASAALVQVDPDFSARLHIRKEALDKKADQLVRNATLQ